MKGTWQHCLSLIHHQHLPCLECNCEGRRNTQLARVARGSSASLARARCRAGVHAWRTTARAMSTAQCMGRLNLPRRAAPSGTVKKKKKFAMAKATFQRSCIWWCLFGLGLLLPLLVAVS